jgi:hypothetical protein
MPEQPHGPQIISHCLLPGAEVCTRKDWDVVNSVVGGHCKLKFSVNGNPISSLSCNGDGSLSRSKLLPVRQVSMLCVVHSIVIPNVLPLVR